VEYILGIDIGTTSVKVGLLSTTGELKYISTKDEVLKNVIVWLDSRAIDEAEIIKKKIPIDKWYKTTGLPEPSPMWPLSKILWLKRNEPVLYDEVLITKSIK